MTHESHSSHPLTLLALPGRRWPTRRLPTSPPRPPSSTPLSRTCGGSPRRPRRGPSLLAPENSHWIRAGHGRPGKRRFSDADSAAAPRHSPASAPHLLLLLLLLLLRVTGGPARPDDLGPQAGLLRPLQDGHRGVQRAPEAGDARGSGGPLQVARLEGAAGEPLAGRGQGGCSWVGHVGGRRRLFRSRSRSRSPHRRRRRPLHRRVHRRWAGKLGQSLAVSQPDPAAAH